MAGLYSFVRPEPTRILNGTPSSGPGARAGLSPDRLRRGIGSSGLEDRALFPFFPPAGVLSDESLLRLALAGLGAGDMALGWAVSLAGDAPRGRIAS